MKKWIFSITSHLIYIVAYLIYGLVTEDANTNTRIPTTIFIINIVLPFIHHANYYKTNRGRVGGGPIYILWNYVRGNNSYNGEEDLIYARAVVSIAVLSFIWIMINKFL